MLDFVSPRASCGFTYFFHSVCLIVVFNKFVKDHQIIFNDLFVHKTKLDTSLCLKLVSVNKQLQLLVTSLYKLHTSSFASVNAGQWFMMQTGSQIDRYTGRQAGQGLALLFSAGAWPGDC